ncbi:MAG: TetR/AcrR family transcriptional regulator [Pseudomonadota bacterium]
MPPASVYRARTEEAKAQRRADILEAALLEIYEKGLAKARLDDIAERANVSKGTVYLYFEGKEELFRDLISHHTAPAMQHLDNTVTVSSSLEQALTNFAAFAPTIIRQGNMPRLMKIIIGESQEFPDILREHRERLIDKSYAIFSKLLSDAAERGEIRIVDPNLTARLIFAPVIYCGVWQSVFAPTAPEPLDIEGLLRTHVDILLKGLNYRDPETGGKL